MPRLAPFRGESLSMEDSDKGKGPVTGGIDRASRQLRELLDPGLPGGETQPSSFLAHLLYCSHAFVSI